MSKKSPVGQRITEAVVVKAYDKYGNRLPVPVDPEKVADKTYALVKRHREKKKSHTTRKLLKAVSLGMLGTLCVIGVTVGAIVMIERDKF